MIKYSYFTILILLMLTPLFSQNKIPLVMIETRVMTSEDFQPPDDLEKEQNELIDEYRQIMGTALKDGLQNRNFTTPYINEMDDNTELADIKKEALYKADLLVMGYLVMQSRRALIQLTVYDAISGRILGSSKGFGSWNSLTFYNSLTESVQDLVDSIDQDLLFAILNDPGYRTKNKPVRILLEPAEPGVEIYINGDNYYANTEEKILELPFHPYPQGQEILLTLKKDGFYDKEITLILSESEIYQKLNSLIPRTDAALSIRYNYYQIYGMGGGFRYYLSPDRLFVTANDYFFVTPDLSAIGNSFYHNDLSIEAGYYPFFSKSNDLIRYGMALGGGVIVSKSSYENQWFLDPYINWLSLFLELNRRNFTLALKWDNRFNFGGTSALLPKGNMSILIPRDIESTDYDQYYKIPTIGLELILKL